MDISSRSFAKKYHIKSPNDMCTYTVRYGYGGRGNTVFHIESLLLSYAIDTVSCCLAAPSLEQN